MRIPSGDGSLGAVRPGTYGRTSPPTSSHAPYQTTPTGPTINPGASGGPYPRVLAGGQDGDKYQVMNSNGSVFATVGSGSFFPDGVFQTYVNTSTGRPVLIPKMAINVISSNGHLNGFVIKKPQFNVYQPGQIWFIGEPITKTNLYAGGSANRPDLTATWDGVPCGSGGTMDVAGGCHLEWAYNPGGPSAASISGVGLPGQPFNKAVNPYPRRPCPAGYHYNAQGSCVPNGGFFPCGKGASQNPNTGDCECKNGYHFDANYNCVKNGAVGSLGALPRTYIVQKGDNIFVIAQRFGMPRLRAFDLLTANALRPTITTSYGRDFASLGIGTALVVPASWATSRGLAGVEPSGQLGSAYSWKPTVDGVCLVPGSYWDPNSGNCVIGCQDGWHYDNTQGGCVPDSGQSGGGGPGCAPGTPCGGGFGFYNQNCECIPPDSGGTPIGCQAGAPCGDGFGFYNSACECVPPPEGYVTCGDSYVACGPNASVNMNDCGCDCAPGYVPADVNTGGAGCVLAPAGGGGGGGTPVPVITTGGGGGGGGGGGNVPPVNTVTSAPAESSNTGTLILGALAVVGIGYGAYALSKKKRLRFRETRKRSS